MDHKQVDGYVDCAVGECPTLMTWESTYRSTKRMMWNRIKSQSVFESSKFILWSSAGFYTVDHEFHSVLMTLIIIFLNICAHAACGSTQIEKMNKKA